MSYFSRFRTRTYGFGTKLKTASLKEITDITNRGKIIQFFQKDRIYDMNYRIIEEGEKPETIAYREYGDSNLYWVILLLNEIKNPSFEWPKNSIALNEYVEEKYKGSSLFLNVFVGSSEGETQANVACRCQSESLSLSEYSIKQGDKVHVKNIFGSEFLGEVVEFKTNTGEMAIHFQTNDFPENEINIDISNYSHINLNTKNTNGEIEIVNLKPYAMKFYAKRKHSIHHFEKNGKYIDFLIPLELIPNDDYLSTFALDLSSFEKGTSSFFDYENFCFSETILGTHLGCNPNENFVDIDYVISNQKYEFIENEKRRQILLPKRRTVNELVKNFDKLFK